MRDAYMEAGVKALSGQLHGLIRLRHVRILEFVLLNVYCNADYETSYQVPSTYSQLNVKEGVDWPMARGASSPLFKRLVLMGVEIHTSISRDGCVNSFIAHGCVILGADRTLFELMSWHHDSLSVQ